MDISSDMEFKLNRGSLLAAASSNEELYTSAVTSLYNTSTPSGAIMAEEDTLLTKIIYNFVVPLLYGLVSVLGIAGNSLVIYVIMAKERMRTVTNLLLLNLATADLLFVLVIPPFTAYVIAENRWPFGLAECRMMHYLVNVTAYVTVYTLVLISVIRFMTIVMNTRTAALRTIRNVVRMIFGIWIVVLSVNIPVLFSYSVYRHGDPKVESDAETVVISAERHGGGSPSDPGPRREDDVVMICEVNSLREGKILFTTFFVCGYVIPLSVIACFSIGILIHINHHKPATLVTPIASGARVSLAGSHTGPGRRTAEKKKQAGRTLVMVIVIFAILWLPVHLHLILTFYDKIPSGTFYDTISPFWNCLAYFNSCVNPIIYNHTSKEFRDAFREVAHCRGCCGRPGLDSRRPSENGGGRRESDRGTVKSRRDKLGTTATLLVEMPDGLSNVSNMGSRRCSANVSTCNNNPAETHT